MIHRFPKPATTFAASAAPTAVAVLAALAVLASCATVPPEERITFNDTYLENGPRMFTRRVEVSTRGEGNEYMVGIRAVSDSTGYLYYASRRHIERERAHIREFGDIYRVDLDTLELEPVVDDAARAEAIAAFSSYRDFRYHEPTDEGLLSGWSRVSKIAYQRTYSFDLVSDSGGERLPVALRWVYDEDPLRLLINFGRGRSAHRASFPPEIFDLSNVGEPDYWRTLSAMRYRADTGHVTFFDSIVDLDGGRRIRLIEDAPSNYVETIAMSPSWERMLILYWKYRETKYLSVLEVTPPRR
ncbi:MAG: hypothetical protein ACLFNX_11800 [Spirochaetaceae bacterium]